MAGYTVPEGCIAGGAIMAFGEGFGINYLTSATIAVLDLHYDFVDIDEQYQQDLQACNQM